MSRRGLVSKSFGPPGGSPGGAALIPKGEGTGLPSSGYLTIDEVATTLRVTSTQVSEWIRKDVLRGNEFGIKPYDLKKFQHDGRDEIARAQAQALKDAQKPVEKAHQKSGGFFAKLFGKGKSTPSGGGDAALARENKKLREELQRARTQSKDEATTSRLEEKVRYLEEKLGRSSSLESEVADLKRQLAESQNSDRGVNAGEPALEHRLAQVQHELANAQEAARQGEAARQELSLLHSERAHLEGEVAKLQQQLVQSEAGPGRSEFEAQLQVQLEQARATIAEMDQRLQSLGQDSESQNHELRSHLDEREGVISELRAELEQARSQNLESPGEVVDHTAFVEELLTLQEANLERFRRLKALKDQADEKLSLAPADQAAGPSDGNFIRLQAEFETLRVKYQSLLEARESNSSGHQDFAEQLAAARATTNQLRQENTSLKDRLTQADLEGWKQKVEELQRRLREAGGSGQNLEQMELELRATRKSLQAREAQVQKIAGRVQENERALKKAHKESTRLTELLIERENRLRDLSTEYEQEYRDKLDTLDRQVSSLQWKLSLRDERIASLESEVSELRKQAGRG